MADTLNSRRRCGPRRAMGLYLFLVAILLLSTGAPVWAGPPAGHLRAQTETPAYPGLDDPDPAVRAETVQALHAAGDQAAVPALVAHLEDPDQRTGLYIAQALVALATREQLTPLLLLTGRANADGRWRAAYVLGERQDSRAIPSLVRALRDQDVLVTRTAAEALAHIGSVASIRALVSALLSPRPSEVHAAMRGLLAVGEAAVPELQAAVESGNREAEKSAAIVLEAILSTAPRTGA